MRRKGGRGAAATHREPLRTHSRSGLALSRRHQGHCNEREKGGERERKRKGVRGRRGRKMKMRGSRQREGGDSRKGGAH